MTNSPRLVETDVTPSIGVEISFLNEDASDPSQTVHGIGYAPMIQTWIMETLKHNFLHVDNTRTPPWTKSSPSSGMGPWRARRAPTAADSWPRVLPWQAIGFSNPW